MRYFNFCMDLIESLRHARGEVPRMCVFDVGLHPHQSTELKKHVETVIEPGWELGHRENYPSFFRAMTARPFLPNYASEAEIIVWIDADAWVQSWGPLNDLICAATSGDLAIVEERFGDGFVMTVETSVGPKRLQIDSGSIKANARLCYERCFGSDIAATYGELPPFNTGVFALHADSPAWAIWRDILTSALRSGFHFLVEQQALCIAIRQGRFPVAVQPLTANYVCCHDLPWYDPASRRFTLPRERDAEIGVLHLIPAKYTKVLPIPTFPHGVTKEMSLRYRAWKNNEL
jgi:hypothetical protein